MILRICIVVLGVLATAMSLNTSSVYGLWYLAGDLGTNSILVSSINLIHCLKLSGYVTVFPLFTAAVHTPEHVNGFGALFATFTGLTLRIIFFGLEDLSVKPVLRVSQEILSFLPLKACITASVFFTLYVTSFLGEKLRRR